MKLYHITAKRNIESILVKGLIPGYNRGLGKGCDVIFLTDDSEFILNTQIGPNWIEQYEPCILEINTESYVIERYQSCLRKIEHEFICRETILPKHIKCVFV